MSVATFYYSGDIHVDTTVELSAEEASHALKSRRLTVGADIQLINGQGITAKARVSAAGKRQLCVDILNVDFTEQATPRVTLATAIPKGDRQKVMLDMVTQLGVSRIVPLDCKHSVTRFSNNTQLKWQRVCIEACKQSQNPWLPTISPEQTVSAFLEDSMKKSGVMVLYADQSGKRMIDTVPASINEICVVVGPEGGFSNDEMKLFINKLSNQAAQGVNFASAILRTETASVVAVAQAINVSCK